MKVVYTEEALRNLDEIHVTSAKTIRRSPKHFNFVYGSSSLASPNGRSAQEVAGQSGVKVVPLVRYLYKVF